MNCTLIALVSAIAATLIVFAIWPQIDLAVSGFFYGSGGFIDHNALARAAREFFRVTPYLLLIGLTLAYLLRRFGIPVPFAPSGRATIFLLATMAIGPGLIVNLVLKDHAHRPRPVHVTQFGGDNEFKPWYRFDGGCAKNCSFVSGKSAQGFWMVAPAMLVPTPFQPFAISAALAFGIGAGALRLAFGGHFLSDALLGGLITLLVIEVARRAIWPKDAP